MGIKRTLFLVVLAGAAAAALTRSKPAEAPARPGEGEPGATPEAPSTGLKATLDSLRRHAREAIEAAHQAQDETETGMRREFDAARRKK
jgi:uncharacterized membrane protein